MCVKCQVFGLERVGLCRTGINSGRRVVDYGGLPPLSCWCVGVGEKAWCHTGIWIKLMRRGKEKGTRGKSQASGL
jgi:hypothetical protein